MFWSINFPLALTAGMLAAFNPCGIVLLPSYVTYIITKNNNSKNKIYLIFMGTKIGLLMTAGFISVFLTTGLAISLVGAFITQFTPHISIIVGFILFVTGLILLIKPEKLYLANSITNLGNRIKSKNKFSYFLYGIGYALVSLGCSLPVFMMVVFTSFNMGNVAQGIKSFLLYSLGMGLVVTLISIMTLIARKTIEKWIQKIVPYLQNIAAILLLFTGAYLVYYWLFGPGNFY